MTNQNYNNTLSEILMNLDNENYKSAVKLTFLLPIATIGQEVIKKQLLILGLNEDKQATQAFLDGYYGVY